MGCKGGQAEREAEREKGGGNPAKASELTGLRGRGVRGMCDVAVTCIDIAKTSDCVGSVPAPY